MKTARDVLGSHSSASLQHWSLMRIVLSDCWGLFCALLKEEIGNISGNTERQGGNTTPNIIVYVSLV